MSLLFHSNDITRDNANVAKASGWFRVVAVSSDGVAGVVVSSLQVP